MARYSPAATEKIATVMREFGRGKLHSSSGEVVPNVDQARAIAMSVARQRGLKVPKKK